MLGQAHTPYRRLLMLGALAVIVLAAPALGLAGGSQSAASLRAQNARLEARSRSAVLQLYSLDQQLAQAQSRLRTLDRATANLHAERASLAAQLHVARHGTRVAQSALARRLRVLYEQGTVEPLDVLLGAENLDEAINGLESLDRIAAQSRDVLSELQHARQTLTSATARLAKREAALAAALQQARSTAVSLVTTRAARTAYVGSLAAKRRLNDGQIEQLVAEARAARQRSAQVEQTAAAVAPAAVVDRGGSAASGARTVTVTVTGYSMPGTTSTGLRVGWGVAAVDPSVIPLGTHMSIPGYGEAVAADTGGAVIGSSVDLWFPTIAQANAWGRRTVTIVLH